MASFLALGNSLAQTLGAYDKLEATDIRDEKEVRRLNQLARELLAECERERGLIVQTHAALLNDTDKTLLVDLHEALEMIRTGLSPNGNGWFGKSPTVGPMLSGPSLTFTQADRDRWDQHVGTLRRARDWATRKANPKVTTSIAVGEGGIGKTPLEDVQQAKTVSASKLFDSIEPHRHLPDETRAALWVARERVRACPEEFADAAAWLDRDYSEPAVRKKHLKASAQTHKDVLWGMVYNADRCDTFPRRIALLASRPALPAPRRLALLQGFYSVPEFRHLKSEFIVHLSEHPENVRAWIVHLTIQTALNRGMWLHDGQCVIPPSAEAAQAKGMVRIDESNVEAAWRSMDEKTKRRIRRLKDERRERDERIGQQSNDRMGRFLEAVRDAVADDIPAVDRVERSRRLVLLAAMIASPEPISLSAEFGSMSWESKGNLLGIDGPYLPGRETLFEKLDLPRGGAQWNIAQIAAGKFGKLITRAMNVLPAQVGAADQMDLLAVARSLQSCANRAKVPNYLLSADEVRPLLSRALKLGAFVNRNALPEILAQPSSSPVFWGRLGEEFLGVPATSESRGTSELLAKMASEVLAATGPIEPDKVAEQKVAASKAKVKGMPRNEANVRVREELQSNPNATIRQLAENIGCSTSTISQTTAWKAVQEERNKGRDPKAAKTLPLTDKILKTVPAKDGRETLDDLIEEQTQDAEQSPLADDPPD